MIIDNVSLSAPLEGAATARTQLAENLDNFLLLLTAQMSNQNPLEPLDATEFTTQLAQFTQVEQAIKMNTKLSELIAVQKSGQAAAAVSYLGTMIESPGDVAKLTAGKAEWTYTIGGLASSTTIEIVNEGGVTVRTVPGATAVGKHAFVWDGLDDNGNLQPEGAYGILVDARDIEGTPVFVQTNFVGRVTGISFVGNQIILSVGSTDVVLDNVISVREAQA
jgi:flagellar basal-body rod modification protein FlgD